VVDANGKVVFPKRQGPSIVLVVNGLLGEYSCITKLSEIRGQGELKKGSAVFVPAEETIEVTSKGDPIEIFQAFC